MDLFLQIVSEYGWGAFLIILVFALLYFAITNKNIFENTKKEELDLEHHSFFRQVQYRLAVEIPSLKLCPDKPIKQQVFIDLLTIVTKSIYDVCRDLVHADMSSWTSDKWAIEFSNAMAEALKSWSVKAEDGGIPKVVVDKFTNWTTPNMMMINEYITILADSNLYQNNVARTNTFLLMINLLLVTFVADAERTIKKINGDLDGIKYKGKEIEH